MSKGSLIIDDGLRISDYPKIAIIILNWNGWKDTIECLESLYKITYQKYDVIIVDNGSKDESIKMIKEYCEGKIKIKSEFYEYDPSIKPIKIIEYTREESETSGCNNVELENVSSNRKLILIKNEKNYGFAEGNNIGMRYALSSSADYILIINNDIVVSPDFLTELIKVTEKDSQIGIAGPTCYYYNWPDVIWATGVRINWWTGSVRDIVGRGTLDKGQYHGIMEVDGVTGCAMLIRKQVLDIISLFDSSFPFGNEDDEFCIRARRRGQFKVVYIPNSKIWHKVARSRKKLMSNLMERHALIGQDGDLRLKSRFQFFKICSPSRLSYISQGIFYFVIALPWSALLYMKKRGPKATIVRIVRVIIDIKNLVVSAFH